MLPQQGQLLLSNHTGLYDLIIPANNLLRKIKELIDFSFVREELTSKYSLTNGRTAEDPVRMFKYLLLKVIYDLSDMDVVERARVDMSFKFFLDLIPEADVINPSSLTKFRKLRLKDMDLLELLLNKTVKLAIEKDIIKSGNLIMDATHTASRSNPHKPIQVLKMRSKQLRKVLYETDDTVKDILPQKNEDDDLEHELKYSQDLLGCLKEQEVLSHIPKVKEKINMLKETLEDIVDHYSTSKDKDARTGHKSKETSFFGFKSHIAMTEEGIITAVTVTSGEKADGPQLPALLEMSRKNGIKVTGIIADTAYSGQSNLEVTKKSKIKLFSKLNPIISNSIHGERNGFTYNKDAGMYVCPAGHMATGCQFKSRANEKKKKNDKMVYRFDIHKCKLCSRQEGCYKSGSKTKTYSVSIKKDTQIEQFEFQETEEFKQECRKRYKIEAKNAELKHSFGYDRAISYGLTAMNMQSALTVFAANVRKIIKLG